jgi:hypothetical protein
VKDAASYSASKVRSVAEPEYEKLTDYLYEKVKGARDYAALAEREKESLKKAEAHIKSDAAFARKHPIATEEEANAHAAEWGPISGPR